MHTRKRPGARNAARGACLRAHERSLSFLVLSARCHRCSAVVLFCTLACCILAGVGPLAAACETERPARSPRFRHAHHARRVWRNGKLTWTSYAAPHLPAPGCSWAPRTAQPTASEWGVGAPRSGQPASRAGQPGSRAVRVRAEQRATQWCPELKNVPTNLVPVVVRPVRLGRLWCGRSQDGTAACRGSAGQLGSWASEPARQHGSTAWHAPSCSRESRNLSQVLRDLARLSTASLCALPAPSGRTLARARQQAPASRHAASSPGTRARARECVQNAGRRRGVRGWDGEGDACCPLRARFARRPARRTS